MLVPCKMFPIIIAQLKYFVGNLGFKDILNLSLVNDNQSCLAICYKKLCEVICDVTKYERQWLGLLNYW